MKEKECYRPPEGFIRFHGRRKGKSISPVKQALYDSCFPALEYKDAAFFDGGRACLEIGFGGGEHLAALAGEFPETKFLGAEPFINGVVSLISHLCPEGFPALDNVRIYPDDIKKILPGFEEGMFDEIYLLYPDPWRKKRHRDRRFFNREPLAEIRRVLKPGGRLTVATDDPTYQEHVEEVREEIGDMFACIYDSPVPPENWHPTRYEKKALKEGRKPRYFIFQPVA